MIDTLITSIFWLSINAYHEARGEDLFAQIAVSQAVMNRSLARNKSIKDTIWQPYQFSWTIGKDPNHIPIERPDLLLNCIFSVLYCYGMRAKGETLSGADHYFNPDLVYPEWAKPEWSHRYVYIDKVGSHKFYKDVESWRYRQ